jgi:hypothetical protein
MPASAPARKRWGLVDRCGQRRQVRLHRSRNTPRPGSWHRRTPTSCHRAAGLSPQSRGSRLPTVRTRRHLEEDLTLALIYFSRFIQGPPGALHTDSVFSYVARCDRPTRTLATSQSSENKTLARWPMRPRKIGPRSHQVKVAFQPGLVPDVTDHGGRPPPPRRCRCPFRVRSRFPSTPIAIQSG